MANSQVKLTDEQKIEIVKKYQNGESQSSLADEYNVHKGSIWSVLKVRGIKSPKTPSELNRKYPINEHYLDIIDTEDKAYFLGFMYADGCVLDNNSITINLQEEDMGLLEYFRECFETTRPLAFVEKQSENHKDQYKLNFNSVYLANRLKELGCWPRKTFTLEFPNEQQIPKYLIKHFIRGYVDGDGHVGWRIKQDKRCKEGTLSLEVLFNIVSTENFCQGFAKVLKDELNIESKIKQDKNHRLTTRVLNCYGNQQVYRLLSWLYEDAEIYLQRKYDKYKEAEELMINMNLLK